MPKENRLSDDVDTKGKLDIDNDTTDFASEDGKISEDGDETDGDEDLEEGDDVLVALGDGEQVNLGELKKSYFRARDYTHKTEALAQERKSVEALRDSYSQNAEVFQTVFRLAMPRWLPTFTCWTLHFLR